MTSSLVDRFGRAHSYLRISLTDRCNLRCTYCMPEENMNWTPSAHILKRDEIIRLAKIFVAHGVTKIRLTGGEPLLRDDLTGIVGDLAALPDLKTIAMTTNGIGLDRVANTLKQSGLDTLTISLDSLKPDRFAAISKRDRHRDVMKGIDAALNARLAPLKINIVVMKGTNDDEILDFIDWAHDRPINLRFIEYMPFPDNHWSSAGVVPYAVMRDMIEQKHQLIPQISDGSAVGKDFAVAGSSVQVSFVTSMTESFCGTCNRLRLTADGNIKSCLFHPAEENLRALMRRGGSDEEIAAIIHHAVWNKQAAHAPMNELPTVDNRTMIAIGG